MKSKIIGDLDRAIKILEAVKVIIEKPCGCHYDAEQTQCVSVPTAEAECNYEEDMLLEDMLDELMQVMNNHIKAKKAGRN